MSKKRILLLGATGSIGRQTLDVLRQHPDDFELVGVSAGSRIGQLEEICKEFETVRYAGISLEDAPDALGQAEVIKGEDQMTRLIEKADFDLLVNAAVGFRGLKPTLAALKKGRDVALANKESLVCGGELVLKEMAKTGTRLYPIDSEHSAIYQCLQGSDSREVRRLIITASGGSFRNKSRDEIKDVSAAQALAHPNWKMGKRITLDSATMVNKGFEVIEAHYLFGLDYDRIDTVLHDESIVHSMVEFNDNAVMAQLGSADMRLPIQYALFAGKRPELKEDHPLDLTRTRTLHFKEMDFERFPMLKLAYQAGRQKGNRGTVFNAADEAAVELFLDEKIGFLDIEKSIEAALNEIENVEDPTYEQLEESDARTREFVKSLYGWQK
ncbi:MAG: 1-deoxy-D-xylulose-5-phosphate reductoisomerase [Erysipelotrichaceae bacterium]|nr:1-deoxy-D-xylulose-5-phosphate reductoisomerase [Erysipelotrichaceae bacterium]